MIWYRTFSQVSFFSYWDAVLRFRSWQVNIETDINYFCDGTLDYILPLADFNSELFFFFVLGAK